MRAHVYWTNYDSGTIGRANLDGSNVNPNFITDAGAPHGVSIYGEHIYWAAAGPLVARANIDGSGVNLNFITGANFSYGIAVDG